MAGNVWLTATAAFLGAVIAGGATLSVNLLSARRDALTRSRTERQIAFADELVAATVFEQLLHRVLNRQFRPVPADLLERINDASISHAAAHAKVQIFGSDEINTAVSLLGDELRIVMQACRVGHLKEAAEVMARLKTVRVEVVRLMRRDLST